MEVRSFDAAVGQAGFFYELCLDGLG
ncbi:hypothetical protein B14911_04864 [Bacillus sp. NRRL B-14911]|nr:hypothetical protein B14911_04864 [Bacillus sp. NRRL B-14911]